MPSKGSKRKGGKKHGKPGAKPANSPGPVSAESPVKATPVILKAGADFFASAASSNAGCPAEQPDKDSSAEDGASSGARTLQLQDWSDLSALLDWFAAGVAGDVSAKLSFPTTLSKEHRADVHQLV
eukprot:jgi/Chrzof1/7979/UNPLg00903.t1